MVIPAFNGGKFAADSLASLQSQTHEDWQAYVMDDGSTDDTPSVLHSFMSQDPRIHVWRQENRGLVATMNTLLDKLDGSVELVSFLDIDDFIHPGMFSSLESALLRNGADVAECGIIHVASDASPQDVFPLSCDAPGESVIDDMSVYWLRRTAPAGWINKQNKLYRRESIGDIRFRPTLSYEDDFFFACEVNASIRKKVKVDASMYAYRSNPCSATSSIPFREYVRSTIERIRLCCEVFLSSGRVPPEFEGEYRADLAKDAYRMCIRKNLRKNPDRLSRRELFLSAGKKFRALEAEYGFSPVGLGFLQRCVYKACLQNRYALASAISPFL